MRNKLIGLNNHLYEQMERLNDENLKGDDLEKEINRAHAMGALSSEIFKINKLAFDAMKMVHKGDLPKSAELFIESKKDGN